MLTIEQTLQYIDIVQHDNHLYEFIFKYAGHRVWEEWFICIEQLYQLPPETKVKIIVDTTKCNGLLSFYNVIYLGKYLVRKYPNRPKPIRVVFLDSEKALPTAKLRLLQAIISTMNAGDETNLICSDNRDKAVDFLFKEEPEKHPDYIK